MENLFEQTVLAQQDGKTPTSSDSHSNIQQNLSPEERDLVVSEQVGLSAKDSPAPDKNQDSQIPHQNPTVVLRRSPRIAARLNSISTDSQLEDAENSDTDTCDYFTVADILDTCDLFTVASQNKNTCENIAVATRFSKSSMRESDSDSDSSDRDTSTNHTVSDLGTSVWDTCARDTSGEVSDWGETVAEVNTTGVQLEISQQYRATLQGGGDHGEAARTSPVHHQPNVSITPKSILRSKKVRFFLPETPPFIFYPKKFESWQ